MVEEELEIVEGPLQRADGHGIRLHVVAVGSSPVGISTSVALVHTAFTMCSIASLFQGPCLRMEEDLRAEITSQALAPQPTRTDYPGRPG